MSAVADEPQIVEVDGVGLAAWHVGNGPDVLLVHGTGSRLWGELVDRLAVDHHVIEYDRRSFGRSAHPPLADSTRHVRDAAELLRSLSSAPAVVVGWSIGGVYALELAARHRELVRGLVMIEPPLHAKRHPRPAMLRALIGVKPTRRLRGERAAAERFLRWAMSERDRPAAYDELPEEIRAVLLDDAAAIVRELDAGTGEHLRSSELRSIDCPAICLAAERSNGSLQAAAERAARLVPTCELRRVADSGHAMQFDQPDEIVRAVGEVAGRG